MLRVKIQDSRLAIEVEGLAETEAAINLLSASTAFMQIPASSTEQPSKCRAPSRAINPNDRADALRAIGHSAHTPEIRAQLKARGITTPSRKDGDLREAMRFDPLQRFIRKERGAMHPGCSASRPTRL